MLTAKNIEKSFGRADQIAPILGRLSVEIDRGEVVSLLGASGCGKSTLLGILAGEIEADFGLVTSSALRPGYLPQERQLLAWRSVRENIALGLEYLGLCVKEQSSRCEQLLSDLGLTGVGELLPAQISGGMKRRIALAQLLATEPDLLFLDEPLTGLDVNGRRQVSRFIKEYCLKHQASALIVTHSIEEAVLVSDRVLIMAGRPAGIVSEFSIEESNRALAFGLILEAFCGQPEENQYRYA